jgi:hypothetical protein
MLFNLNNDFEEQINLVESHPKKLLQLETALDAYLHKVKAPKWKPGISWKQGTVEKINSYH